jgi:hypothetical protein
MVREIDARDYSFSRATGDRAREFERFATETSARLPEEHTVKVARLNALTGTPTQISSTDSPPSQSDLIGAALSHVQSISATLGFAPSTPAEFVPDSRVQETSARTRIVHLRQQYRGIPVFQMARAVRFTGKGQIADVRGDNVQVARRSGRRSSNRCDPRCRHRRGTCLPGG